MDRVALPAEVAETHVQSATPDDEQCLQMPAVLRRLDIRAADKGDNIARLENETRIGKRLAPHRVRADGAGVFPKRTGRIGATQGDPRHEQTGEHAAELNEPCAPASDG
jgi:hypothetical protein